MLAELSREPRAAKAETWPPRASGCLQTWQAEDAVGWRSTAQPDVVQVLLSVTPQPPPCDPRSCLWLLSQAARVGMMTLTLLSQATAGKCGLASSGLQVCQGRIQGIVQGCSVAGEEPGPAATAVAGCKINWKETS